MRKYGRYKSSNLCSKSHNKFLAGEGEEGIEVQHNNDLSQLRPTEERFVFGKLMQLAMERLFDPLHLHKFAKDISLFGGPHLAEIVVMLHFGSFFPFTNKKFVVGLGT